MEFLVRGAIAVSPLALALALAGCAVPGHGTGAAGPAGASGPGAGRAAGTAGTGTALAALDVTGPGGVRYRIVDEGVPAPIAAPGDPERGARLAYSREAACTLCHQLPPRAAGERPPEGGDIAPPLAGSGSRRKASELRLRMIDSLRVNPDSVMPAYFRTEGLRRVAAAYGDRPVFDAQQIEDVVAWLVTLK